MVERPAFKLDTMGSIPITRSCSVQIVWCSGEGFWVSSARPSLIAHFVSSVVKRVWWDGSWV